MRGFKAKTLRRFARSRTVGKKDVEYREKITPKTVTMFNTDGTTRQTVVHKSTRYMVHDCTRKYYKLLKAL